MSETKAKILQSAIDIWGKNLTHSLEDIADRVGISRRTLHRHYNGRDDLMNSVICHVIDEYLMNVEDIMQQQLSNEDKLKAMLEYDIKSSSKYRVFCQVRGGRTTQSGPGNENVEKVRQIMATLFSQLIKEEIIPDSLPLIWLEMFFSAVAETALNSIGFGISQEKCLEIAWASFYGGITLNNK